MAFPQSFSTTADCPFMENSISTLTVKLSASQSGTPIVTSSSRFVSFAADVDERSRTRAQTDSATLVNSPSSPQILARRKGLSRMSQSGSNRIANSESISSIMMTGRPKSKSISAATVPERKPPQTTMMEASTSTRWFDKARDFIRFGEDSDSEKNVPDEQKQALAQTHDSVSKSLRRVLGCVGEVALETLVMGMESCEFLPVPALQGLSKTFLAIWKAAKMVSMNRAAFLSTTRRCADIMDSIHEEIARASPQHVETLRDPISDMEKSFDSFLELVTAQLDLPFLARYLKREDIAKEIVKCNDLLLHSLQMFTTKVQIRAYAATCANYERMAYNHGEIIAKLDAFMNVHISSPPLPLELKRSSAPPELDGVSASLSPRSLKFSASTNTISHSTDDLHEMPAPPQVVPALQQIQTAQNIHDERADVEDLERNMQHVLKQGNDAAFFSFLGIDHSQMPEAIKTLQRILESRGMVEARSPGRMLHREFLETGIEALRRLSMGRNFVTDLPVWTITHYEIDKGKRIGMGKFSEVFQGTWNGRAVAIKQLSSVTPYDLFIREIKVWKALSHPNVLKLYGASSATANPPWFFVSPYMENQTLVQFLKRLSQTDLEESEILELGPIAEDLPLSKNRTTYGNHPYRLLKGPDMYRILQEIAKGMEYLHCKNILHGDLKAANVLVDKEYRCVISDFGQSEIKSEVCRITGSSLSDSGTLRWKAPELFDNSGMLTLWTDIYAYAIVCIEVLTMGDLPWGAMDDEDVRVALLDYDERPVIPIDFTSPMLHEVVEMSWVSDPERRAPFSQSVARLARLKQIAGDGSDILFEDEMSPSSPPSSSLCLSPRPTSPTPTPNTDLHPRFFDSEEYVALPSPQEVDALRMEDNIPYATLRMPEPVHYLPNMQVRPSQAGDVGGSWDSDYDNSRTVESRCPSPPPLTDALAEGRNERRYRYLLEHEYNASLTLPLWDPSLVQIGDVGYLSKPSGTFVALFNALKSHKHPSLPHNGLPSMADYGNVAKGTLRMDKRNVAQKGLDAFSGFLTFNKSRSEQPIVRRQSFRLHAGHRCAHIYTESAEYHYMKKVDASKAWFKVNVGMILHAYGQAHNIQKEDLFLVISLLQASNYGLIVSHRHPEGQAHFNVFAGPKKGHPWGTFTTDTKVPGGHIGPSYEESNPEEHEHAVKISNANDPPKTILLGRLRFKPDSLEPTTAK